MSCKDRCQSHGIIISASRVARRHLTRCLVQYHAELRLFSSRDEVEVGLPDCHLSCIFMNKSMRKLSSNKVADGALKFTFVCCVLNCSKL